MIGDGTSAFTTITTSYMERRCAIVNSPRRLLPMIAEELQLHGNKALVLSLHKVQRGPNNGNKVKRKIQTKVNAIACIPITGCMQL